MTKKRQTFTTEFKKDAVKRVTEKKYSQEKAAEQLGISISALGRWIRSEKGTSKKQTAHSLTLDEQAELKRLRKENKRLIMARDILKKAAVFFAKEHE